MNRLIILEDDLNFSRSIFNYVSSKINNIRISNLFINGEEMMADLKNIKSNDILLLDLEVPKITGVQIIEYLKINKIETPYIIVMSGNTELLRRLKKYSDDIYKILEKPFNLGELTKSICQIVKNSNTNAIVRIVESELSLFGFNTLTVGYEYIMEAITLALQNEELLKDMKNNLYPIISKEHNNINVLKIKWSIEKCIDALYRTTNINLINEYFYIGSKEKLTPKVFFSTIIDNLSNSA